MCEFFSWVRVGDKAYYLTDEQVFSVGGRLRLRGTQDNDVLGHTAIRRYYCIFGAGSNRQEEYFWQNPDLLPEELRPKLATWKSIDAIWGRMLRQALTKDDLKRLLFAPTDIAQGAWDIIMERPDRNDILKAFLMECTTVVPSADRALATLASSPDGASFLASVAFYTTSTAKPIRAMARRHLSRLFPTLSREQMMECLISSEGGDERGAVMRKFLALKLPYRVLRSLWPEAEGWSGSAALNRLALKLARHPRTPRPMLVNILVADISPQAARQVWHLLKARRPSGKTLGSIALGSYVSDRIAREAERMLKRRA